MLQNAYLLAKIGADTAENEQHFAENLPKADNYPTGPTAPSPRRRAPRARGLQPLLNVGPRGGCVSGQPAMWPPTAS